MARAIGLDIGARSIKVVELAGSAKAPKIQRLAVREIPPPLPPEERPDADENPYDPDTVVVELINEMFASLQLPKDDVCAAFDSGVTMIREITVPFFEDDQIRKVVKFEAENHLHSHAIEDVVVNWIKTGETRDGSRLTIFASPKVDLARRISILRRAGIEPASVDLDSTALFTALESAGVFEENPNVVVIDIGAHSTNLILVVDGKPRVLRSFLLGTAALESEVVAELGVSAEEGRRRVLTSGAPQSDDLFVPASQLPTAAGDDEEAESEKSLVQIQTDVVGERRLAFMRKLQREANRSIAPVQTDTPPEKIILLGGGALVPECAEFLGDRLELPVERMNLLDRVPCKDAGPDPQYAGAAIGPAIGCGLRMMGRTGLGVELLQDEFSPKNTFDVIRIAMTTAVTLLFLIVLGVTFVEKQKFQAEQRTYNNWLFAAKQIFYKVEPAYLREVENKDEKAAQKAAERWLRAQPKDHTQINRIRNRLRKRHSDLQVDLGLAKNIPKLPSATKVMLEIYKALSAKPRESLGGFFQIQKMHIRERNMSMTLIMDDPRTSDTVRDLLQANEYLRSRASDASNVVEIGSQQRLRQENLYRQEISMKFKDEE